jgi:hypothetical protein
VKLTLAWSSERDRKDDSSRASNLVGTLAAVVTILTPVVTVILIFVAGSPSTPATILAVYVCLVTTVLLWQLIKLDKIHKQQLIEQEARHSQQLIEQEVRGGRMSRYAAAMGTLRKGFGCVASASWTMLEGDGSEETFTEHLRHSLQFLAELFSSVTEQPCRASIKMTSWPNHGTAIRDVVVYTLCRSDEEDIEYSPDGDLIRENTDFKRIFEENDAYFFCNDLPTELGKGYQNSHWDRATIQAQSFKYRATIVWPISRARARMAPPSKEREVIGFLCVDTPTINSFIETYDVPIGMAFAGGLHLALNRFRTVRASAAGTSKGAVTAEITRGDHDG